MNTEKKQWITPQATKIEVNTWYTNEKGPVNSEEGENYTPNAS